MQPEQPNSVTPAPAPTQPVGTPPADPVVKAPKRVAEVPIQQVPDKQTSSAEQQATRAATPSKQSPKQPSSVNVPMIVAIAVCIVLIATTVVAYTQG